jgi:IS1 family transposase/transposase-like protein
MLCLSCQGPTRRFGRNRNGSQRYRCDVCARTFTDPETRPADGRFVPNERIILCLRMLWEGNSLRSTERLTAVRRETIIDRLVAHGRNCQRFLESAVRNVPVRDIQADEVWGFVFCKEKTRERTGRAPEGHGDAYCFTALNRFTKMIVAWHLGKRCPADTRAFALKLHRATHGRFQLTTDGYRPYLTAIPSVFGANIDFATLVKVYGEAEEERRYSPPRVVDVVPTVRIGNPEEALICTSHVERSNLTIRMTVRRLTRLTNAFSKKWANHEATLALFFAYYNFCRVHMTLKTTPAVRAGLTSAPWSLQELLDTASTSAPADNAFPPAIG